MRVLLVEDHPGLREMMTDHLAQRGPVILRETRARTAGGLPILVVTARDALEDRVQGDLVARIVLSFSMALGGVPFGA